MKTPFVRRHARDTPGILLMPSVWTGSLPDTALAAHAPGPTGLGPAAVPPVHQRETSRVGHQSGETGPSVAALRRLSVHRSPGGTSRRFPR